MSNNLVRNFGLGFVIWWIFCSVVGLASSAAVIYVLWHFISKFW